MRTPVLLAASLIASTGRQAQSPRVDPAPHEVRRITVDQNVDLEVLEWGGTGQPVVLLSGSGHTAHVFDEFAAEAAGLLPRVRSHPPGLRHVEPSR